MARLEAGKSRMRRGAGFFIDYKTQARDLARHSLEVDTENVARSKCRIGA
jgi:hypothetical protein